MKKKITVFPSEVDCQLWETRDGRWKGSISIGEEYYETDPYKDRECVIAELKGWWDGIKIQIDPFFKQQENDQERI